MLFSPDGTILAVGNKLWDADMWNQIAEIGGKNSQVVAFSQDNTIIAIEVKNGADRDIHLWDITTPTEPEKLNTIYLPKTFGNRAVTLSPKGNILVEATKFYFDTYCEAIISLWDVQTGDKLLSLPGHTEPIETLTFSHDGKTLASGSEDGTVLLWDWDKIVAKIEPKER